VCVSLGLKKPRDFTVSEGHGYPLVWYNIYSHPIWLNLPSRDELRSLFFELLLLPMDDPHFGYKLKNPKKNTRVNQQIG
jgi:hypothetical protein